MLKNLENTLCVLVAVVNFWCSTLMNEKIMYCTVHVGVKRQDYSSIL